MADSFDMQIQVKCPNAQCGRMLAVKGDLAGTKGKCPACGSDVEIPQLDAEKGDTRLDMVRCGNSECRAQMRVPIGRGKIKVKCPKCNGYFYYDAAKRREALLKELESPDPERRLRSVRALGAVGDERAALALLKLYFADWTPDPEGRYYIRDEALDSLKSISVWGTKALIDILDRRDQEPDNEAVIELAAEAAQVLGYMVDERAVDPLIARLKDENVSIARAAAVALGRIGDDRAVVPLERALEDAKIRVAAMEAMRQIGGARASRILRRIEREASR